MCPCSVSLLPFHLQFTEVPQKSDPSLLGLVIPLDPQNTWCCCGVTKHPLPALGMCQSLKAQNKLSTLRRNSRKSWRCGKDRGTQPQRGPVHFQKCHQALLLSYPARVPQRWHLLRISCPVASVLCRFYLTFLVTHIALPGGTLDFGEKIWLPGQTLTVIYYLLSKMFNFFGLQVLSKIRLDMIYINVLSALVFHEWSMHAL